jgi:hypothetical protein
LINTVPPEPFQVASSGEHPVTAVAAELERLAECSPNPAARAAFRRASRALYQQPSGRPPTNDRKLLRDIDDLLAAGHVKSVHDAIAQVAATVETTERALKTTVERLRRKRKQPTREIVLRIADDV